MTLFLSMNLDFAWGEAAAIIAADHPMARDATAYGRLLLTGMGCLLLILFAHHG